MRPTREVSPAATLSWVKRASRVNHPLKGIPEDLARLGGCLAGVAHRVELERPDPALEAKVGRVSPASVSH